MRIVDSRQNQIYCSQMDGIDQSQWLPKGTPVVNAWRERQGGVLVEGKAYKAMTWLPDILLKCDRLSKEQYDTARSFERIYMTWQRTLGTLDIKGQLGSRGAVSAIDIDMFYEIRKEIPKSQLNACISFVTNHASHAVKSAYLPPTEMEKIIDGLEAVQKVLDNVNKMVKNTSSTAP